MVFALAQLTSELFYSVLCAIVYFLSFYYPAGFNTSSDRAGYFFAMILVVEVFAVTLGQAVSALNPSVYLAALANPFLIIIMSLFCGVTIPKPNLPHFWRVWMYQLNPFTRLVSGLVSNELHDLVVVCKDSEFSVFQPPSGQSCGAYGDEFINFYGGYLNNPNATTDCQYCPCEYHHPLRSWRIITPMYLKPTLMRF